MLDSPHPQSTCERPDVESQAPDLCAALLLNQGRLAEARNLLGPAVGGTGAGACPELYLLATNAFGGAPGEQLARLNAYLAFHRVPALALKDSALPPAPGNVRAADRVVPEESGPLVTVLMTTFNSACRVEAAANSVLEQSWRNLELIVVDDASEDGTRDLLQQLALRDARVRVVCLPRNGGTYLAKLIGLQHARGEFVTCHDSDDWALPCKIERQIRPLLNDARLIATVSCWVRLQDDGRFYARQIHPLMRLNPASPLFRRERVLREAGAWDLVRTGADSEFLARLKLVFGRKAVHRIGQPLTLGSHRAGSLMTDVTTGYSAEGESPVRSTYWDSWSRWHAASIAGGAKPWLPIDPLALVENRAFAAPSQLLVPSDVVAECLGYGAPGFSARSEHKGRWVAASGAVGGLGTLPLLLDGPVLRARRGMQRQGLQAVLAWERKPSAVRAGAWALRLGLPLYRIEDGFLRSFGTGDRFPPLSLVVDKEGIYYDATHSNALEAMLESDADLLTPLKDHVALARQLMMKHRLSKYNQAPSWPELDAEAGQPTLRHSVAERVLVVDQTAGDMSVAVGGATEHTFATMLAAAMDENPRATIYVKTHPEVASGRKAGYYSKLQGSQRVVLLRQSVDPLSLVGAVDRVYVVSSTLGFEALLAGKPVTCFGMPWYASWGVTDDRQTCPRRTRKRTVDELFAAAYFHYTRYLNPETHERGTIFDVIGWLVRQKEMANRLYAPDRMRRIICVGYRRWKAANLQPMLSLEPKNVVFGPTLAEAPQLTPSPGDWLVHWGAIAPEGLGELASRTGAEVIRMEDGFVRSVGLGSDLIRPRSLTLDRTGIYFDPTRPSDLENLLNAGAFSEDDLQQAREAREFIVAHGITKYNLEPRTAPEWPGREGRRVLLVPGQVEDDASIRLGCTNVRTNLALLQAARADAPDAYIVYKPHPDVTSGNRAGRIALKQARAFADHVETSVSVVSCIEACDEVHTMTSLSGFDALLRGKRVVTYGQPFYAGWGLTEDRCEGGSAFARRTRRLTLDELVAGTLIRYPIYWDWTLKGYTTCTAVLRQLVAERDALEKAGKLDTLRTGWWRRQARKARILWHAWTT